MVDCRPLLLGFGACPPGFERLNSVTSRDGVAMIDSRKGICSDLCTLPAPITVSFFRAFKLIPGCGCC